MAGAGIWASVISVGGLGLSPPAHCAHSPLDARDWFLVLFEDTCPGPGSGLSPLSCESDTDQETSPNCRGQIRWDTVRHLLPDIKRAESGTAACRNNSGVNTLLKNRATVRVRVLSDCDEVEEWWNDEMMTQYSYRSSSVQLVMWRIQIMSPVVLSNQNTNGICCLVSTSLK